MDTRSRSLRAHWWSTIRPTPSPSWTSYIFPDTVEPDDPSTVVKQKDVINLTDKLNAEAFTSSLDLGHHPYSFKASGEELFCEGINHLVLHVYAHQTKDGVPGNGTAFHRNTPWFMQSRDWVKYLQRCHHMLQQGEPVADVAVYIGDFAPQMAGPANPVPAGYDYDYIGSDAILRRLHVVDGEWVIYDEHDSKRIAVRYKLLAMPKVKHIRSKVLKRLEALETMKD